MDESLTLEAAGRRAAMDCAESQRSVLIPDCLDRDCDPALAGLVLASLTAGHVGVCLSDAEDRVRYVNGAFSTRFFGQPRDIPFGFVDALADAIRVGRGIKLTTLPLEAFVARVRERRASSRERFDFAVDMTDGSWWWVNDHKLPNGWLLAVASDISGIKDEEFRLRHAHAAALKSAQTDFLTGLANRRHGFERAEAAVTDFRENRLPLSIALIDIDHFKRINDTYGHDVGDRVLVHCADTLARSIGPQDQISRIGGEEFLVVMPGISAARAERRLEQVLLRFSPLRGDPLRGDPLGDDPTRDSTDQGPPYTVSAGVTSAHPADSLKDLLHRADVALYAAKAKGRHRVELNRKPRLPPDATDHG